MITSSALDCGIDGLILAILCASPANSG